MRQQTSTKFKYLEGTPNAITVKVTKSDRNNGSEPYYFTLVFPESTLALVAQNLNPLLRELTDHINTQLATFKLQSQIKDPRVENKLFEMPGGPAVMVAFSKALAEV